MDIFVDDTCPLTSLPAILRGDVGLTWNGTHHIQPLVRKVEQGTVRVVTEGATGSNLWEQLERR